MIIFVLLILGSVAQHQLPFLVLEILFSDDFVDQVVVEMLGTTISVAQLLLGS